MKLLLALALIGIFPVLASDLDHAPPSFSTNHGRAVFIDLETAHYEFHYDVENHSGSVSSLLTFRTEEEGQPLFDVVSDPLSAVLDGTDVEIQRVGSPERATTYRIAKRTLKPGAHTLKVVTSLSSSDLQFMNDGVLNYFNFSDMQDRHFLELYAAAGLEYDRVQMSVDLFFENARGDQDVFSNGKMTVIGPHHYHIDYPSYFTSSSIFLTTAPKGYLDQVRFTYTSIDGRKLPITIFMFAPSTDSKNLLSQAQKETHSILAELEADYGPFLHPGLTISLYPSIYDDGMEYCGAATADLQTLGHEILHNYFARGIMPVNGASGWLDEAIAQWRDNGYPRTDGFTGRRGNIGSFSPYQRYSSMNSYVVGSNFMAYLDGKFAERGGLKPFLRHLVEVKKLKPYDTQEIIQLINEFYKTDLTDDFKTYVLLP